MAVLKQRAGLMLLVLLTALLEVLHMHLASRSLQPSKQKQQQQQQQQQEAQGRQQLQQEADEAAARLKGQRFSRHDYLSKVLEKAHPPSCSEPDKAAKAFRFERLALPQPSTGTAYHAPLSVHISPTILSSTLADTALFQKAIRTINTAIRAHAPSWVQFADSPDAADVILQHTTGCTQADIWNASVARDMPIVLLQHSLQGCRGSSSSSSGSFADAAEAWAQALLVVSPFSMELIVQGVTPELQQRLRLWSMAWGADEQLLRQQPKKQLKALARSTEKLVVSFGSLPAADAASLLALLTAAADTQHTLVFFGPSQPLQQLCSSQTSESSAGSDEPAGRPGGRAGAGWSAAPAMCRHLHHFKQEADQQQLVQYLKAARYVALLHETEAWQEGAAAAVLLGKRLLLFNMTQPHQPYRWLRPFATLIEPVHSTPLLRQQLRIALTQDPPAQQDLFKQRAIGQLGWHALVPRLFDRIFQELHAMRFPSPAAAPLLNQQLQPPKDHILIHKQLQALTEACSAGNDNVLYWNSSSGQVVQQDMQQHIRQPWLQCPAILLLISSFDRSIGMCQDAAQLALYWDVPLVPAALLMQPMEPSNNATFYHQHCKGSVILSLGIAYSEVLDVMRLEPAAAPASHQYWFMPNYDIMNKWQVNTTVLLTKVADRILCKTRACQQLMQAWLEHNGPSLPRGAHDVMFTSFSTPDPTAGPLDSTAGDGAVTDYTQFLHVMGKSPYKSTVAVVDAWARNPDLPPITISTYHRETIELVQLYLNNSKGLGFTPLNIRMRTDRMSVSQLNGLTTGIGNHLCPSEKEGFSHYINQAQAAGALLLTTDYPPMREFAGSDEDFGLLCPYHELWDMEVEMFSAVNNPYLPRLAARSSPETIETCVRRALALSVAQRQQRAARGRQRFLQQLSYFRGVLRQLRQEAEQLQVASVMAPVIERSTAVKNVQV